MDRYNPFELRKFVAPEFLFGSGAIEVVDRYIKNLGVKKVMVVTDPGVINAGWAEVVERLIKGTGIPFVVFSELTPNPKDKEKFNLQQVSNTLNFDLTKARQKWV